MKALEPGYHLGDALDLLPRIPDASIDLVFTSPPAKLETQFKDDKDFERYHEFLRSVCGMLARIVKPKGFVVISITDPRHKSRMIGNHILYTQTMADLGLGLRDHKILVRDSTKQKDLFKPNYQHFLAFTKKGVLGRDRLDGNAYRQDVWVTKHQRFNKQPVWPQGFVGMVLRTFTERGDLVVDPFAGRGPVPYGCKRLGRNCIAIELSPDLHNPNFEGLD